MPTRSSGNPSDSTHGLASWVDSPTLNFFDSDLYLQSTLRALWGTAFESRRQRLSAFGGLAATAIDRDVRVANEDAHLPRLARFDPAGRRIEEIRCHPAHDDAGRLIYGSELLKLFEKPGRNSEAMVIYHLSAMNGEAGHNCPIACSTGIIKVLRGVGTKELQARFLSRLMDPVYDTLYHGAQYLTEIQGGSDVGENRTVARCVDRARGTWRIDGEKWFCSNASADLALITARPEGAGGGTKNLGLFLVPRRLEDGQLNGVHLLRLKEKLGTRSLPTAEISLRDAHAWQIGEIGDGFRNMMRYVVNTSRLYNCFLCTGAAQRAWLTAYTYAQRRTAFGQRISAYPLVRSNLADIRAHSAAMLSGSLYLAFLLDEIETGRAAADDQDLFRLLLNLTKYQTSISATQIVLKAIEILGGNGTIEGFSVLPRLLRDCLVYENWEGSHNVLVMQVLRDTRKYQLHDALQRWLETSLQSMHTPDTAELRDELARLSQTLFERLRALLAEEGDGGVGIRPLLGVLTQLYFAVCMCREIEADRQTAAEKAVIARHYLNFVTSAAMRIELPNAQQSIAIPTMTANDDDARS